MINAIKNALSGMAASRKAIEASASNIANVQTVGSLDDPDNAPYTPLTTKQTSIVDTNGNGLGVKADFIPKNQPFVPAFDPSSPFADENGVVGIPNVSLAEEAINIKMNGYIFEANARVIAAINEMSEDIHHIFDRDV